MAPLQKCDPSLIDLHFIASKSQGKFPAPRSPLQPAEVKVGFHGAFTPGVIILGGGCAHDVPVPREVKNHGTVLFCSTNKRLQPDLSHELMIKDGTEDERVSRVGSFEHGAIHYDTTPVQLEELNHGKVLFESQLKELQPDLSYEGTTNVVGGRPTERRGLKGGFTPGVRIMRGGCPRKAMPPVAAASTNCGTVLFTSTNPALQPDVSREQGYKAGTDGERFSTAAGFQPPASKLRMPTAEDAARWRQDVKPFARRYGEGHYCAGVTQWKGIVMSKYPARQ